MLKKILAAATAAVMAVSMSGCSKYTMTEEDLELQRSLVGYWAADYSTGYNEFDENGNLTMMTAVQFTDDFKYLMYDCYLNEKYVLTYEPISYTIEEGKFKVDKDGVASYAAIGISGDGMTMSWITDEGTDKYVRFSEEEAMKLGFPEYDPEMWEKMKNAPDNTESGSPEDAGADTAADTVADITEEGSETEDSSSEE